MTTYEVPFSCNPFTNHCSAHKIHPNGATYRSEAATDAIAVDRCRALIVEGGTTVSVLDIAPTDTSPGGLQASFYPSRRVVETGHPLHLVESSSCRAKSWKWDFGDGTASTDRYPTKTFSRPGLYRVTLTVSDGITTAQATRDLLVTGEVIAPARRRAAQH